MSATLPVTPPSHTRIAVLAVAALLLWFLLGLLHLTHYSEKFHVALPLLWALDFIAFRPERTLKRSALGLASAAVLYFLVWSANSAWARQLEGELQPDENLWWFLYLLSIIVLYQWLYRAITFAIKCVPAWRPKINEPRGWPLRVLRVVLSLGLFFPYVYTAGNAHRVKVRPKGDPRTAMQVPFEHVVFEAAGDGTRLDGWFIPAPPRINGVARGTVLLVHGLGAHKGRMLGHAQFLHHAGFNVFVFDLRGHGASGGHTTSFGYYEARDVRAACAYLRRRRDTGPIAAMALSMGGSALLQAVPHLPELQGVIVDSTFADLRSMASSQLNFLPAPARATAIAATALWTRAELGVGLDDIAPVKSVGVIVPRPLLLIHGTGDAIIPDAQSQKLLAAAGAPKELWLIPGAGHVNAINVAGQEYEKRVTGFLRGCFNAKSTHRH